MVYPFSSPSGDEEALNQQFAGYLQYSLEYGPELLNTIHSGQPLSFSDEARIVANQDSPLPQFTEGGPNREIDWVVGDEDKLVGYESKYHDSLSAEQLRDELAKLRLNAGEREVALVAVTMHTTPVSVLDQFADEPVYWLSWFTIFRRLRQTDEASVPPEQHAFLRILEDLFEAEDMHPFTGFDHTDKSQYRHFIRDLRQELVDTGIENRGTVHTWTTTNPEPTTWKRIVPRYLDIPFVAESRGESGTKRASSLTVLVDTETNQVYAGIVFNVRQVPKHRDYIADNLDAVVATASDMELQLWTSMNSVNEWKHGVAKTEDPAMMRKWLEDGSANAVRVDETDYKKAMFVSECTATDPAALVQETKERLLELYKVFLVADDLYPWSTLED